MDDSVKLVRLVLDVVVDTHVLRLARTHAVQLPLTSPANSHRCNAQSPPEGTSKGSMYVLRVYAKVMPFSVMFITGWSDVPRI